MSRFVVLAVVDGDTTVPVAVNVDMVTCAHVVDGVERTELCLSGGHRLLIEGIFEEVMAALNGGDDL